MKLVIFGLSVSSSWGNGHATLWRGLIRALARQGHRVVFFERDVSYYAQRRDLLAESAEDFELVLYPDWPEIRVKAKVQLADADVGIVTSYCPDAVSAAQLILDSAGLKVFYDLDTPITLSQLDVDKIVPYLPPDGLADFDLVLSYTGGRALSQLTTRLGARRVAPLFGAVDPEIHRPVASTPEFSGDLSYLGTYSTDRQERLDRLFLQPARRLLHQRFRLGGAMYPPEFPWTRNIWYHPHVAPADHPAFYCASPITLNVTRQPMAAFGDCPSGRLFEAAACGVPVLSDRWEGIERFFEPDEEILIADQTEEAIAAIQRPKSDLFRIGRRARERVLAEHTAEHRARELVALLTASGPPPRDRAAPAGAG